MSGGAITSRSLRDYLTSNMGSFMRDDQRNNPEVATATAADRIKSGGYRSAIFSTTAQNKVHSTAIADVLDQGQEHAVNGVLAGTANAHHLLGQFPHSEVLLTSIARHSFADGTQTAFRVSAGLAALAFVIAAGFIKGRPRLRQAAAAEPSAAVA